MTALAPLTQHFEQALDLLGRRESLSREQAQLAMNAIIDHDIKTEDLESFLLRLKEKGESIEEISGFVDALKSRAKTLQASQTIVMDVCGTGGDGSGSFNISTTVALLLAAQGVAIAKHGNRSVSSRSGSFDVLQALDIAFHSDAEQARKSLDETNIAFLFAPDYHPAFAKLATVRRKLGVRTVINLLGPILNPVRNLRHQLMGIYDGSKIEQIAAVLQAQGVTRAMVVHGHGGVDEISLSGPTQVAYLHDGVVERIEIKPGDVGFAIADADALRGGSAAENAQIILDIFAGEMGPRRNVVLLNAAAALVVSEEARDLSHGVEVAAHTIDSGNATRHLHILQQRAKL